MKKTVWSIFRDLVNSKAVGTEITRQEILDEIERQLIEDGTFIETKGVKGQDFLQLLWIVPAIWPRADIILKRPNELVSIR